MALGIGALVAVVSAGCGSRTPLNDLNGTYSEGGPEPEGAPPNSCGNGKCDNGETCSTCALDCGVCPGCGDGICQSGPPNNETCASCPQDCGVCDFCGNGKCEAPYETCANCVADCGQCQTIDCSQELQCALKCFNLMSSPPTFSLTCLGDLFGESKLLAVAKAYQDATGFHSHHPATIEPKEAPKT